MDKHTKEDLIRDVELVEMIFGILPLILSSIIIHSGTLDELDQFYLDYPKYVWNTIFILLPIGFWASGLAYIVSKVNYMRIRNYRAVNLHLLVPSFLGLASTLLFTCVNVFLFCRFYL